MRFPNLLKFISERYPLTTAHVGENEVQDFDNLYLDVTKIAQDSYATRPNEQEEQVWKKVCDAISRIFTLVKPKKAFYLVIDGVTPRSVENVQRLNACIASSQAWCQPSGLDANCVVAGTQLSTRLAEQLRYFVAKKVSEDPDWSQVEVALSGPDVPGDGNQKIMEYIRLQRSLKAYNPDTRHCIYGLEDEKLLLGMTTYDTHTSLLVDKTIQQRFVAGPSQKKCVVVHVGLLREYLYREFECLDSLIKFPFMNVRMVDDFVCLCLLVKNKYLPQLPHLESYEDSLECIMNIYKDLLPTWDGYLHESGHISMERLETITKEISLFIEKDAFDAEYAQATASQETRFKDSEFLKHNIPEEMTEQQKEIYSKIRNFLLGNVSGAFIRFNFHFTIQDRSFLGFLTKNLKVSTALSYNHTDQLTEVEIIFSKEFSADRMDSQVIETLGNQSEEMREMRLAFLNEYEDIPVVSEQEKEQEKEAQAEAALISWNEYYYREKINIDSQDGQQMNDIVDSYMTGIQWVLHYFYTGVASWSWFYPYRYAPKASDLKNSKPIQDYPYDLGGPLKPHEHLMMSIPKTGRRWLPTAYQSLVAGYDSTVMDFYPQCLPSDVSHDKSTINIPFINQKTLLTAMEQKKHLLTAEDLKSNKEGHITRFVHDSTLTERNITCSSPLPEVFPDVNPCLTSISVYSLPSVPTDELQRGCTYGAKCGSSSLGGFPSFQHLSYDLSIEERVAPGTDNATDAMFVKIENKLSDTSLEMLARCFLFRHVCVGYPFMKKAIVTAVSSIDGEFRISENQDGEKDVRFCKFDFQSKEEWNRQKSHLEKTYSDQGIIMAEPDSFMMYVVPLTKVEKLENGLFKEQYANLVNSVPVLAETVVTGDCSYVIPREIKPQENPQTTAWTNFALNENNKQSVSHFGSSPPKRESQSASRQPVSSFGAPQRKDNQWPYRQHAFPSNSPSSKRESQWASRPLGTSPPKRENHWANRPMGVSPPKRENQWANRPMEISPPKRESQWAGNPMNSSPPKRESQWASRPLGSSPPKTENQWTGNPTNSSPPKRENQWAGNPTNSFPPKRENQSASRPMGILPPKTENQWTGNPTNSSPPKRENQWTGNPTNSSPPKRENQWAGNPTNSSPPKRENQSASRPMGILPPKTENQWTGNPTNSSPPKRENQWSDNPMNNSPPKRESQWASYPIDNTLPKRESQRASRPLGSSPKRESQWASYPVDNTLPKRDSQWASRPVGNSSPKRENQWASRPMSSSPPTRDNQWSNYQNTFPSIGSPPRKENQWASHQLASSSSGSPQRKESQWASRSPGFSHSNLPSKRESGGSFLVGSPNKNSTAQSAWGEFARSHEKRFK